MHVELHFPAAWRLFSAHFESYRGPTSVVDPMIFFGTSRKGCILGLYNAEISAGSLLLPESRRIAKLLLGRPTPEQWDAALNDENLLQKKPATARRQARLRVALSCNNFC